MDVFEKIKALLDTNGVDYEVIEHAPVFTSEEAALVRDTSADMGAKALVCYGDKKPVLIVVPGNTKLNTKSFKSAFGVKDLRFATAQEVEALIGVKIGAIPPLGKVLGLKSYYSDEFKNKTYVAFNAGLHTVSIKMQAAALLDIECPLQAHIT